MGRCVLSELVIGGNGLDGYFGEQGLPAGIQECLERFHRRCVDHLSRQFVPKCATHYAYFISFEYTDFVNIKTTEIILYFYHTLWLKGSNCRML